MFDKRDSFGKQSSLENEYRSAINETRSENVTRSRNQTRSWNQTRLWREAIIYTFVMYLGGVNVGKGQWILISFGVELFISNTLIFH